MNQELQKIRRRRIGILLIAGILFMGMFLYLFFPIYNTNDDLSINRLVDGARGIQTPYTVYQHIFLGYLYTFLYRTLGGIPWYGILQYVVIYLSLAAIGYCLVEQFEGISGWILYVFVQLIIGHDCYVRIQFTKTAGVAACAGAALLILALRRAKEERRLLLSIGGTLLICVGLMYREKQALTSMALMGPAALYVFLQKKEDLRKKAGLCLRLLAPLLLLTAGLHLANEAAYARSPWTEYRAFNRVRGQLLDFGMPDFEEHQEELEELHISREAYDMLRGWTFADPEVFTTETLEKLMEMKPARTLISRDKITAFFKKIPDTLSRRRMAYLFYAGLLIWLLLGMHSKIGALCIVLEVLCFGGLYYYLFAWGRYLVEHVDVAMLMAAGLSILLMIRLRTGALMNSAAAEGFALGTGSAGDGSIGNGLVRKNRREISRAVPSAVRTAFFVTVILILTFCAMFYRDNGNFPLQWRHSEVTLAHRNQIIRNRQKLAASAADTEHFYLARLNTLNEDEAFEVFDVAPAGISANVLWLGGWSTYSEYYLYTMAQHDITNPLRDAIDREDLILVENNIEQTIAYLEYQLQEELIVTEVDLGEAASDGGHYAGYQLRTSE